MLSLRKSDEDKVLLLLLRTVLQYHYYSCLAWHGRHTHNQPFPRLSANTMELKLSQ